MLVSISRREILLLGASALSISTKISTQDECLTFQQAAQILDERCPSSFINEVRRSGHFLYRGESITCPKVVDLDPDLFDPKTYGSEEAVRLFQCIEAKLSGSTATPSIGHIGTATKEDARQWGDAVSIWPTSPEFGFIWPKQNDVFFPGTCSEQFVEGTDLAVALKLGKEVMIRGPSFLMFPDSYDNMLWSYIDSRQRS